VLPTIKRPRLKLCISLVNEDQHRAIEQAFAQEPFLNNSSIDEVKEENKVEE
jgi:hypothetical protein